MGAKSWAPNRWRFWMPRVSAKTSFDTLPSAYLRGASQIPQRSGCGTDRTSSCGMTLKSFGLQVYNGSPWAIALAAIIAS